MCFSCSHSQGWSGPIYLTVQCVAKVCEICTFLEWEGKKAKCFFKRQAWRGSLLCHCNLLPFAHWSNRNLWRRPCLFRAPSCTGEVCPTKGKRKSICNAVDNHHIPGPWLHSVNEKRLSEPNVRVVQRITYDHLYCINESHWFRWTSSVACERSCLEGIPLMSKWCQNIDIRVTSGRIFAF